MLRLGSLGLADKFATWTPGTWVPLGVGVPTNFQRGKARPRNNHGTAVRRRSCQGQAGPGSLRPLPVTITSTRSSRPTVPAAAKRASAASADADVGSA